ncbi:13795_t:CDS:2, partial [Funneliformis caledonium]
PFQITTTPKRCSVSRCSDERRYCRCSSERWDYRNSERQNRRTYKHSRSPPYRHNRSSLDRFSQSPLYQHNRSSLDRFSQSPSSHRSRSLKYRGRSSCRSSGKSSEQNELASIRNTLDYLVKEVKNLKANSQFSRSSQSSLRAASVTPVPSGGYDSRRIPLEKMNNEQFKNFRDEVVQILSGFDNSLSIDHTQKWNDICDHVFKEIMPAVNQALTVSLRPQSLPEETFKEDIAEIIDNFHYHSDEVSETDIEKAREKIRENIRPKNKAESKNFHVIRVYDKPWRSRR